MQFSLLKYTVSWHCLICSVMDEVYLSTDSCFWEPASSLRPRGPPMWSRVQPRSVCHWFPELLFSVNPFRQFSLFGPKLLVVVRILFLMRVSKSWQSLEKKKMITCIWNLSVGRYQHGVYNILWRLNYGLGSSRPTKDSAGSGPGHCWNSKCTVSSCWIDYCTSVNDGIHLRWWWACTGPERSPDDPTSRCGAASPAITSSLPLPVDPDGATRFVTPLIISKHTVLPYLKNC